MFLLFFLCGGFMFLKCTIGFFGILVRLIRWLVRIGLRFLHQQSIFCEIRNQEIFDLTTLSHEDIFQRSWIVFKSQQVYHQRSGLLSGSAQSLQYIS